MTRIIRRPLICSVIPSERAACPFAWLFSRVQSRAVAIVLDGLIAL
jgi:hypothetical protein